MAGINDARNCKTKLKSCIHGDITKETIKNKSQREYFFLTDYQVSVASR